MEYAKFTQNGVHYVVRLDPGEEILTEIASLCEKESIKVGSVVGLGAVNRVTVGLFDTKAKVYHKKELVGPMEISSLVGNLSTQEGKPYLHFHINVCDEEMNIHGGHLNEAWVSATAELTITVLEGTIERKFSEEIGLNLYRF